jgi:3-hydroxybutyryl-CoA dehydrogenase
VTVVGAGVMGRGIAYVAAVAGAETRLVDLDEAPAHDAMGRIARRPRHRGRARQARRGGSRGRTAERLTTTTDLTAGADGAGLVVEAVVERMDVKHQVLTTAERAAADDAILATNTSAMSITEIVACLDDPSRGVGMHFFNPVPR